jgi:hypothetical protein
VIYLCKYVDWTDVARVRGLLLSPLECSNEPSGSIKDEEFLDWLSDC